MNIVQETKLVRARDIAEMCGIGLSTVWRYARQGKLPKPHGKLSPKVTVWRLDEVQSVVNDIMNGNKQFPKIQSIEKGGTVSYEKVVGE
jgi:predicted DNA-binding transcriptional regulator AlpA